MTDLFVKVRTVLFFDYLTALLTDGLVKLDAVAVARRFSTFATDVFVEGRAVAIATVSPPFLPASRTDISRFDALSCLSGIGFRYEPCETWARTQPPCASGADRLFDR